MKTSKAKVTSKPKKTSGTRAAVKEKRVPARKSMPTEDEIRIKAQEIYNQRISHGEYGNALDDWRKAEELLRNS